MRMEPAPNSSPRGCAAPTAEVASLRLITADSIVLSQDTTFRTLELPPRYKAASGSRFAPASEYVQEKIFCQLVAQLLTEQENPFTLFKLHILRSVNSEILS